jgi:tRNA pseudouridine55 synthase
MPERELGAAESKAPRWNAVSAHPPCGIIVLDKPSELGSNAVLSRIKGLLKERKMGFLGTLDPLASGVLPVFVGKATRLIALFEGLSKTYRVTLKLGERTDTFDALGKTVETRPWEGITEAQVREAILSRAGRQNQAVPAFSAVKIAGVPAYRLARQGEAVPERIREVDLWDVAVEEVRLPEATFRLTCSSGTYMRSLVEDLGLALGPGAHLTALRRLACGSLFTLADSVSLEGIGESLSKGRQEFLRNPAAFLPEYQPWIIAAEAEPLLRNGQTVPGEPDGSPLGEPERPVKALRSDGTLIAVGRSVVLPSGRVGFRPSRVLI